MRIEAALQEILTRALELPWDHHLYLKLGDISLQQEVFVLNDNEENERDIDDEPLHATGSGFKYYLSMQDVQSVVENLQAQIGKPSPLQLLEALKHYHINDSFIEIKG